MEFFTRLWIILFPKANNQQKEYYEGVEAYYSGKNEQANPYVGSYAPWQAKEWSEGFRGTR
jgi:hypothetical protein